MTKYSLRARMMILILAPTLLIGLLLSAFFVVHRYHELQNQVVSAGASIIDPLAMASVNGMTLHNRDSVRQLVNLLHRHHSNIVRSINVFDANNQLFVSSNYHQNIRQLQLPAGSPLPQKMTLEYQGGALIMRTPIVSEDDLPSAGNQTATLAPLGYITLELNLDSVRVQQYEAALVSTLLLLLCLCIAMLFAYRLMRDVTGPIRNMVNTVDRIRRGQLDSRVEGYMLGELAMLKNGINSMAVSLAAYHEEMQQNIDQATSDLRETLEQMEIQNVELDLAKKRAQEAVRIKSEFLANMSHELRTPLNGVIGFTRQTLKTSLSPTQRDYLHTIERSGTTLLDIINDVLDFSKLEAGKLMLEAIPFALRSTFDDVIVLLAQTAHEKGLEITLDVQQDVPDRVIGDPLRLQQVMTNLLGNAIKFTEQGNIDIRIEKHSADHHQMELEMQIHDTGIGIAEDQQSQLFQAFRQADASITRSHGGTGLGLVITQKLVKEMGGSISFRSEKNCGSSFWFQIPLQIDGGADDVPPAYQHLRTKRMALVEHNPAAAQATLNILAATPLMVSFSPTLEQLPAERFDFLLLGKPVTQRLSLIDLKRELALAAHYSSCIILVLPSQSMVEAEHIKHMGAFACLTKPVSANRLLPLLNPQPHGPVLRPTTSSPRLALRVMAVDDNPANLKLIGALLQEQVGQTILCANAREALAYAGQHSVDIILMDIQMPEIDGLRASELIRQLPGHAHTPIVAVTAHSVGNQQEKLQAAGMDDYLAKPIDEQMLRRLLTRYCHHAGATDAMMDSTLDWPLALRQAANKPELAQDLLTMLIAFLPEVKQRIVAILNGGADEHIGALIHKLHGSCSYSGVPKLKRLCADIEGQLRAGSAVVDLEPEWLEMLDEFDNVALASAPFIKR
ncbi:two-component sensor histidine kinase BarA [Acerihabitans sp. TG2]|uniref:two-component sensor histidine kinase BarA n=1 Tax=Acerihabitans sp. TG2 TaxID=3096008 RepID=UPI002B23CE1B|nr:two-component sensor histidine kinase BarA [Acerihabitans sp. TG2]MEA9391854.1 two-component sensor histidine kinase BarA [Acerihabitans sp. TG2]